MAFLHRRKDLIPLAFNIGAIGVELDLEARFFKDLLASGHVFGDRDPDPQGNDTKIRDDPHWNLPND
jgi:hypothetical protein